MLSCTLHMLLLAMVAKVSNQPAPIGHMLRGRQHVSPIAPPSVGVRGIPQSVQSRSCPGRLRQSGAHLWALGLLVI